MSLTDNLKMDIPPIGTPGPDYAQKINDALAAIEASYVKVPQVVGDDTADDTNALQDAIDELPDTASQHGMAGGIVLIPPHVTCKFTKLRRPRGVSIIGHGGLTSRLHHVGSEVAIQDVGDPSYAHNWAIDAHFGLFGDNPNADVLGHHAIASGYDFELDDIALTARGLRLCLGLNIHGFGDSAYMWQDGVIGAVILGGAVMNCRRLLWVKGKVSDPNNYNTENILDYTSCQNIRGHAIYSEDSEAPYVSRLKVDTAPALGAAYFKSNIGGTGGLYQMRTEAMPDATATVTLDDCTGVDVMQSFLVCHNDGYAVLFKNGATDNNIEANDFPSDSGGINIFFEDEDCVRNKIHGSTLPSSMALSRHVSAGAFATLSQNDIREQQFMTATGFGRRLAVDTALTVQDNYVEVDATAGNITITLPDPRNAMGHEPVVIKKIDATTNWVAVTSAASQTIDGANTRYLTGQYDTMTVIAKIDGTAHGEVPERYVLSNRWNLIGRNMLSKTVVWDPASVADGAVVTTTVTVKDAAFGDPVTVGFSGLGSSVMLLDAHVSAADTVLVVLENRNGAPVDLGSGNLKVVVTK